MFLILCELGRRTVSVLNLLPKSCWEWSCCRRNSTSTQQCEIGWYFSKTSRIETKTRSVQMECYDRSEWRLPNCRCFSSFSSSSFFSSFFFFFTNYLLNIGSTQFQNFNQFEATNNKNKGNSNNIDIVSQVLPSMFPLPKSQLEKFNLNRCIRILPHQQVCSTNIMYVLCRNSLL